MTRKSTEGKEKMRRLICRILGHRWTWPEVTASFNFDTGFIQVSQDTACSRCGCAEPKEFPDMLVHLNCISPNWRPVIEEGFGEKVDREMGWQ